MSTWVNCSKIADFSERAVPGITKLRHVDGDLYGTFEKIERGYINGVKTRLNDDGWHYCNIEVDPDTLKTLDQPVLSQLPWIGSAADAVKIFGNRLIGGSFSFGPDHLDQYNEGSWDITHVEGKYGHTLGGFHRGVPISWNKRITILTLGAERGVKQEAHEKTSIDSKKPFGPDFCCKRQRSVFTKGVASVEHSLNCSSRIDIRLTKEKEIVGAHGSVPAGGIKADRRIRTRWNSIMANQADLEDLLFCDE